MCGRFAVTTDPALLAEKIKALDEATEAAKEAGPNFNVAPTTTVSTVVSRHQEPEDEPTRRVRSMRWGLVPSWVKVVSVDINPAVVTKLSDRGSTQTVGVVTDVGLFLHQLAIALRG